MKTPLIISICLIVFLEESCIQKKDDLLMNFQIGKSFKSQLIKTCEKDTLKFAKDNRQEIGMTDSTYYFSIYNNEVSVNYIFNSDGFEGDTLRVLTLSFHGPVWSDNLSNLIGSEFTPKPKLLNLKYVYKKMIDIYGKPDEMDTGNIDKALYMGGPVDFLFCKMLQPLTNTHETKDVIFKWNKRDYDIELICSKKLLAISKNEYKNANDYFFVINYKMKNYDIYYQNKLKQLRLKYTPDDLVSADIKASWIKFEEKDNNWKSIIIPDPYFVQKGIAEYREITDIKFDIEFSDVFNKILYVRKNLIRNRVISQGFPSASSDYYSFCYNSYLDHDAQMLNFIEKNLDKIILRVKIKSVRFEDGEVRSVEN